MMGKKSNVSVQSALEDQYMPLKALNTFSSDWKIKARIVKKHDLRRWKNERGEGEILNIDLMDR